MLRNRRRALALAALPFAAVLMPSALMAQDPAGAPADEALRVFLDCTSRWLCDDDFFRREVPFVNYVRDREDAEVHVLIIAQDTGAGGESFTLDFIGREDFEGRDDRLTVSVRPDVAEEERLEAISRGIAGGLMQYVAQTGALDLIRIQYEGEAGAGPGVAAAADDPWDFWVFRVGLRGEFEAEDRQDDLSFEGSLSGNRVTDLLKVELEIEGEFEEENFEIDDSTTITTEEREYRFESLVVHSLGDHWSLGGQANVDHSTFRNRDLAVRVAPALEYSLFPYEESERKQLTILYTLGFNSFRWRETTLFGEESEFRVDQSVRASLAVRQPWGELGGDLRASHFIDDIDRNRFSVGAFLDLRITRGLSLDLRAEATRVRDQINLPSGDATPEEVLLELRELQTGTEYDFSIGFSYRFGSIFNNVVNPRFDSGF